MSPEELKAHEALHKQVLEKRQQQEQPQYAVLTDKEINKLIRGK